MAGARKLLRASETRGAGADHRHLLAGLARGRLRRHPARFPRAVDDGVLDRLDADRVGVDAQHARFLTRRGADPAGELGEVVGRVQRVDRALPVAAIHQVVPVRDDVVHRAARHAERRTAVHAARALHFGFLVGEVQDELAIVLLARVRRLGRLGQTLVFHETRDLSHAYFTITLRLASGRARPARVGIPWEIP